MPKKTKKQENSLSGSSMLQAHGKLENEDKSPESFAPRRLSQILAASNEDYPQDFGYYNTDDAAKYEEYIKAMPRSVLDEHCRKVGFIPTGETSTIVLKLLKAFKQHWQSNIKLPAPKTFSKEQADRVSKILRGQ